MSGPGVVALLFVVIVVVIAILAIRLGMLAAPHLDRLANHIDEDDRGDHD